MRTGTKITVMQAYVNGAKILSKEKDKGHWEVDEDPQWDWPRREYQVLKGVEVIRHDILHELTELEKEFTPKLYQPLSFESGWMLGFQRAVEMVRNADLNRKENLKPKN